MKTNEELALEAGFKASVGKTDKEGNYHPYVNALSKDVPIEWVDRFASLVEQRLIAKLLEGVGSPFDHLFAEAKVNMTRREVETMIAAAVLAERERACEAATDAIAFNGGTVQMEAHVRAAIRKGATT